MLNKLINSFGDWNHAFVATVSIFIISLLAFAGADIRLFLYFVATAFSFLYLGKEHQSYIKLGEIGSFFINNWKRHDRRQTILMWVCVWLYAFIFNKFIYGLIA